MMKVEVGTEQFEWSWGAKPRGQGSWMFWLCAERLSPVTCFPETDFTVVEEAPDGTLFDANGAEFLYQSRFCSYSKAKRSAVKEARSRGLSFVEVCS